ncbi:MarR family transcriptional regulator [Tateyamaria omphalii]|uniref:MarR family winged helix-turn-helix transcriptional regulator n=1 Tax=Tateyamaria omphalii TaxID=299262 RepID=UPI001C98FF8F|nr:MarR family transcriptional regulator [Tateyamaria omphalii]MBY5931673.1 MarR family transcriptional regulator [Tateyamaria omphalii]
MFFLKDLPSEDMIAGVTVNVPEVSSPRVLSVLTKLRAASVLLRDVEAYLRGHGLSQTQFLALMMIMREPERSSLSAVEIAARLDVSKPVLSKALASLADKGLIAPAASQPADRRQKQLSLTPEGEQRFADVLPGYFSILHDADL